MLAPSNNPHPLYQPIDEAASMWPLVFGGHLNFYNYKQPHESSPVFGPDLDSLRSEQHLLLQL